MISADDHHQQFIVNASPSKLLNLPLSSLGLYRHVGRNEKQIYSSVSDKRDINKFVGKQKQIVKYFLNISQRTHNIEQFMKQYSSPSKDFEHQGGQYNFFNYVSRAKTYCEVSKSPVPRIAYFIFKQSYQEAIEILMKEDIPMQINLRKTLLVILNGYQRLTQLFELDESLKRIFMNRQTFDFVDFSPHEADPRMKKEDEFIEKKKEREMEWIYRVNNMNDFSAALKKLSKKQRAGYVYRNINKLKSFLKYISKKENNGYLNLILYFLSNSEDQIKSNGYYQILLNDKDFVITDRLNYAQILLNLRQRKLFVGEVEKSMLQMTNLTNLLMFPLDGDEISNFELIIQKYLDETGDLETIAWICLAYGEGLLMKYIDMYLEKLILAHEFEEAEKLQYEKTIRLDERQLKPAPRAQKMRGLFINNANMDTERYDTPSFIKQMKKNQNRSFVADADYKKVSKTCYICFKERAPDSKNNQESFVECSRCKHGGHLSHILKWYEQTRMCPKNDCPCLCN